MRLIDADYLKENMVRECRNIGEAMGVTMPVLAFTHVIDDAPTIEERPKGKWELYQYQESRKKDWYCTDCATIVKKPLEKKYIYCPYCGVRMED